MNKIRTGIVSAAVLSLLIVFIFLGLYLLGWVDGLVSLIVGVPFGILGAIFTLWWILLVINHPFAESLLAFPSTELSVGPASVSRHADCLTETPAGQQSTKLRVSRLERRGNKLSAKQISEIGGETEDECVKEVRDNRLDQMTQDTQPEAKEEKRTEEAAAASDSPKADELPGVEEKIESAQSEATECAMGAERKTIN